MSGALVRREQAFLTTGATQALTRLEEGLGGRDKLTGYLLLAPMTPDLQLMVGILGDPKTKGESLASICARSNILPGEVLRWVQQAAMATGKALAAIQVAERIPAVVGDILEKAAPYKGICSTCQGTSTWTPDPTADVPNPIPEPCPTCNATGELIYQPAFENQKLAVELAHLLPKAGGFQLNQQFNQGSGGAGDGAGGAGAGSLEKLQSITDQLLYTDRPTAPAAVDAELVDPGSATP